MRNIKYSIGFALLFMFIGIAFVSTNLVGNISTLISSNSDDFLIYFSDVKINGEQDLSIVYDAKTLKFYNEFSSVGDKIEVTYDVTNASKNYDADILINCTGSTDYLNVTYDFDTSTSLAATSTRTGNMIISLKKSYVGDEFDTELKCTLSVTAVSRTSIGSNNVSEPVVAKAKWVHEDSDNSGDVSISDVMYLENDYFNIIEIQDEHIVLLAQNGLTADGVQSSSSDRVPFSGMTGWEYTPGPKEIDIYTWSAGSLISTYVDSLKELTGDNNITGDLITLKQLKNLGCTISDDYSYTGVETCVGSPYEEIIAKESVWWTKSAESTSGDNIWAVVSSDLMPLKYDGSGTMARYFTAYWSSYRPTVTVSKNVIK